MYKGSLAKQKAKLKSTAAIFVTIGMSLELMLLPHVMKGWAFQSFQEETLVCHSMSSAFSRLTGPTTSIVGKEAKLHFQFILHGC